MLQKVLTIAGSDCSGGAGIQADIKTITAHGCYAMSVITALTAQNTTGVFAVQEATPEMVGQQLDAVFTDIVPDAVKIGMVSNIDIINIIAEKLHFYKAHNIVLDPVMISTSGSSLISKNAQETLLSHLFPLAKIATPNILEAQEICGFTISNKQDMEKAARAIYETHHCDVLVKGGHAVLDANDFLYAGGESYWYYGTKIDNPNTHGTGCTLSSAIASELAMGHTLKDSIARAKEYISKALSAMLDIGKGSGPLNHMVQI